MPGINLQVNPERLPGGCGGGFGGLQHSRVGDCQGQVMFEEIRNVFRQGPACHENRPGDADFPQVDAFVKDSHANIIDMRFDVRGNAVDAMTVGIGLEHHQHLGRVHPGANRLHVAAELGEVDNEMGGAERGFHFGGLMILDFRFRAE